MRILIVGAGAIGGYFGGRLVQSGADVSFLVRPKRREALAATGLVLKSPMGDFSAPVKTVLAEEIAAPYDLIFLSCKAYDLDNAIASLTPAMGPNSALMPMLNGMAHLDRLNDRFGEDRILGGLCAISSTLGPKGEILHLNNVHLTVFGEQNGQMSDRVQAIAALFGKTAFASRASDIILQEMWEKWVFLSSLAAVTCLMRANVGEIVAAGGAPVIETILDEVRAVAAASSHAQRAEVYAKVRADLTDPSSTVAASMLRDLEKGGPVEADHVLGDLIARGERAGVATPLLSLAYTHLKAAEQRWARRGA